MDSASIFCQLLPTFYLETLEILSEPPKELILCVFNRLIIQMHNLNHITTWLRKVSANFCCLQIKNKFINLPFYAIQNRNQPMCCLEYFRIGMILMIFQFNFFCVSLRRLGLQGLSDSSIIQQIVGGVKIKPWPPQIKFSGLLPHSSRNQQPTSAFINQELGSWPLSHSSLPIPEPMLPRLYQKYLPP